MSVIDADSYYKKVIDLRRHWTYEPTPINRAPMVNLQKLPYEKKIIPIALEIKLTDSTTIRDRFDWDLNELITLSPTVFATKLVEHLHISNKQKEIERISNSILDQMLIYIDRNTFFPRVRFSKKQEEIINEGQICVNCDSLMKNLEVCPQCEFSYEKKLPYEKKLDDADLNIRQSERVKASEENKKKGGISLPVIFKGKEKQTCKNCGEINPFFRTTCKSCSIKFSKK